MVRGHGRGQPLRVPLSRPGPRKPIDAALDSETRQILARALGRSTSDDTPPSLGARVQSPVDQVRDALINLETRALQRRQRELRTMLAEADRRNDIEMSNRLQRELVHLMRRLREL